MPTKTRAAVQVECGKPVVVEEVELPDPGPMHVIVKQFASGSCHSQLHRLHNPNQAVPGLLGHKSTGVVVAKGSDVSYLKEGDLVVLSLFPSGHCRPARRERMSVRWRVRVLTRGAAPGGALPRALWHNSGGISYTLRSCAQRWRVSMPPIKTCARLCRRSASVWMWTLLAGFNIPTGG